MPLVLFKIGNDRLVDATVGDSPGFVLIANVVLELLLFSRL